MYDRLDPSHTSGSKFPEGTTTIQYKATDGFELTSFCSIIIEVTGISCEALSEPTSIVISPEICLSDPRFGDICTLECEQTGFKITPPNLRELTCNSDQTWSGNTEEVQCVDLQAPEFEDCPQDMVVFVNRGEDTAYVGWSLVVRDNDPQSLELVGVCNQQPGMKTIGEYIISCSAVDEEGNEGLCQFTLEVKGTF
ncbi:uncharacterized protein LOC121426688 [Lytechinus variegatus]|uniref:uncharacterized protein LOC121426688 n=1 Tax=Lytechinus variegatus TaxID=7654 RepID=UPI001BB165A9|nr:uncharacterized protein LOC121426688 [Lytechinus variegatus]